MPHKRDGLPPMIRWSLLHAPLPFQDMWPAQDESWAKACASQLLGLTLASFLSLLKAGHFYSFLFLFLGLCVS